MTGSQIARTLEQDRCLPGECSGWAYGLGSLGSCWLQLYNALRLRIGVKAVENKD